MTDDQIKSLAEVIYKDVGDYVKNHPIEYAEFLKQQRKRVRKKQDSKMEEPPERLPK